MPSAPIKVMAKKNLIARLKELTLAGSLMLNSGTGISGEATNNRALTKYDLSFLEGVLDSEQIGMLRGYFDHSLELSSNMPFGNDPRVKAAEKTGQDRISYVGILKCAYDKDFCPISIANEEGDLIDDRYAIKKGTEIEKIDIILPMKMDCKRAEDIASKISRIMDGTVYGASRANSRNPKTSNEGCSTIFIYKFRTKPLRV